MASEGNRPQRLPLSPFRRVREGKVHALAGDRRCSVKPRRRVPTATFSRGFMSGAAMSYHGMPTEPSCLVG